MKGKNLLGFLVGILMLMPPSAVSAASINDISLDDVSDTDISVDSETMPTMLSPGSKSEPISDVSNIGSESITAKSSEPAVTTISEVADITSEFISVGSKVDPALERALGNETNITTTALSESSVATTTVTVPQTSDSGKVFIGCLLCVCLIGGGGYFMFRSKKPHFDDDTDDNDDTKI